MPTADIIYGCDDHWWDEYASALKPIFGSKLWTQSVRSSERYGLNLCEGESKPGLGKVKLHFGSNSGYQAINLAYLLGASKIVLLGYDMKRDNDKVHFFGDHPYHKPGGGPNDSLMRDWCDKFVALATDLKKEGVEVVNATRSTALTAFNVVSLEHVC